MDERIRRAALRAALKTAIVVSLSGCYQAHSRGTPAALVDASLGARDAGTAPFTDAVVRRDSPTSPDAPAPACGAYLASLALADGWCAGFEHEADAIAARTVECCATEERAVAAGTEPHPEFALASACCSALGRAGLTSTMGSDCGCAVGGPMVPPEMPNEEVV